MTLTIEEAVRGLLLGQPDILALCDERIYPQEAPQEARMPYVIYQQADQRMVMSLRRRINLNSYLMRLDCFAASYAEVKELHQVLLDTLVDFRGDLGGDAIQIRGVFHDGSESALEAPVHADEQGVHSMGLSVTLWYRRS